MLGFLYDKKVFNREKNPLDNYYYTELAALRKNVISEWGKNGPNRKNKNSYNVSQKMRTLDGYRLYEQLEF